MPQTDWLKYLIKFSVRRYYKCLQSRIIVSKIHFVLVVNL